MKVLTVLTILYSFYVCKCINSDSEDEGKSNKNKTISELTDKELDEKMKQLRLGAKPKQRKPLTSQFEIDFTQLRLEREREAITSDLEKLMKIQERQEREKERKSKEKEKGRQDEEKKQEDEGTKTRKRHAKEKSSAQKPIAYGYPPYDPKVKHFAPGPIYPPPDPKMLDKPPASLSSESFIYGVDSKDPPVPYSDIPPPPTSFPRPCQCPCGPGSRHQHQNDPDDQQDQGAEGGQPQQAIQPQQYPGPDRDQTLDQANFEPHKSFPPYGQVNIPPARFGGVQVLPPPPPPAPFQTFKPTSELKKPTMYKDITDETLGVVVETKKGFYAYKSKFMEMYNRDGRLCHVYTPEKNCNYIEVTYKDETIWRTTSDKRCIKVEICNIGFPDKLAILHFNTGYTEKYKKIKNKWSKI